MVRESELLAAKAALRPSAFRLSPRLLNSKNNVLRDLAQVARKYNLLLPAFLAQRRANAVEPLDAAGVALLDRMSMLILAHLAAKSPMLRHVSGREKWNDVVDLKDQLEAHARYFNVKLLRADISRVGEGGKDGEFNFWLERLDPDKNALNQADNFYIWANSQGQGSYQGSSAPGLLYLDETQREEFRVHAEGGRVLYNNNTAVETRKGSATWSGRKHVYIYVCSARTRQIYTFDSREKVRHHSSFLSGQPVLAAGTWLVEDGEVLYVDGESGHYQPTAANLRTFAAVCSQFWNPDTIVRPFWNREHYVTMRNFSLLGDAAPPAKGKAWDRCQAALKGEGTPLPLPPASSVYT